MKKVLTVLVIFTLGAGVGGFLARKAPLAEATETHADMIRSEILATEMTRKDALAGGDVLDVDGQELRVVLTVALES